MKELFRLVSIERVQNIDKLHSNQISVGIEVEWILIIVVGLQCAPLGPLHFRVDKHVAKTHQQYREREQAADECAAAAQRCRELPLILELELDLWSKRIHFAQSFSASFPHIYL